MSIDIGSIRLADPVILAPMSGVTDLPFRRVGKRHGGGLVGSVMVASAALTGEPRRSLTMAANCSEEQPMAVQLAGCEPGVMAEAAKLNADRGAALIDINLGCPVTLKMRTGWDADNRNAPQLARIAEQSGIRMITVHGRTRCQFYAGRA